MDADPKRAWGEARLDDGLHRVVESVERWPRWWLVLTVLIVSVSGVGYRWLDVETDFTRNFRASSDVVRSYAFVETNLGGAGVWDILIPAPRPLTEEYLARVRRLEERLRIEVTVDDGAGGVRPGLTKVMSLTDAIDALPLGEFRSLMPLNMLLSQFQDQMPTVMESLLRDDPDDASSQFFRIMLRAHERQTAAQKNRLIEQVRRISREEFEDAQVSGFFILLTKLIDSMIRDQWFTFSIACVAILVMMFLAFRSLPLAFVALVPNMLPIIVVTGLMGWLGIRINMGAAMIAAVSVGLSVDSSIHYITSFLEVRRQGHTLSDSISLVHQSVGRAMFFSTLALIVGFSALMLSQFVPTVYFGVLVSISMFGGMLGNLVVLPVLLRSLARWRGEAE